MAQIKSLQPIWTIYDELAIASSLVWGLLGPAASTHPEVVPDHHGGHREGGRERDRKMGGEGKGREIREREKEEEERDVINW